MSPPSGAPKGPNAYDDEMRRRAQGKLQEDIAEDAMQSVGKAARGVWNFLTSSDTSEALRKIDRDHGTNLGAAWDHVQNGPAKGAPLEEPVGRAIDRMAACKACGTVHLDACASAEGEVLIIVEEDAPKPCAFCRGKQVVQLKATVRTAIKCPTCGKNPAAKPKALGK